MAKRAKAARQDDRRQSDVVSRADAERLRRRRMWIQLGVIAAVVIVLAAVAIGVRLATRSTPAEIPTGSALVTVKGVSDVPLEIGDDRVRFGSDTAPVVLSIYEDFSCPHCQDFEATAGPVMEELVAGGDVVLEFHPIRIVTDFGNRAGSAMACVAVGAPQEWWSVRSALFAAHDSSTDSWSGEDFRALVAEEVSDDDVLECVAAGRYERWVDQNTDSAFAAGVTSTPTVLIDGEPVVVRSGAQLRDAVEDALTGG